MTGIPLGYEWDMRRGRYGKAVTFEGKRAPHLLVIGPNGSGKGTRLLIPALLQMPGRSIVVIDPKGELAAVTAAWRRTLGDVVVLNPFGLHVARYPDLASAGYNPLASLDETSSTFYDAQGRRKSKTVGSATTIYVTDAGNREVLEYNGTSGAVANWYAYGLGPNTVLGQMNGAGTNRETLVPDIQGSIVGTLDASTGTLSKTGYQPFGGNPNLSGGSFQYTAARFDSESGLYYMRTRMYRTDWGRFMQPDTIGYGGGNNLYAYTNNDPLNNVDPSGLFGFGGTATLTAEAGVPYLSAGGTDTSGAGVFFNLFTLSPSISGSLFTSTGLAETHGNLGQSTNSIPPTPSGQANGVLGAIASASLGGFITNATTPSDLNGVSRTWSLNTPVGSLQFSSGNGTWVLGASVGPGFGASVSSYPTVTNSAGVSSLDIGPNSGAPTPGGTSTPEGDAFLATLNSITAGLGGPGK